MKSDNDWLSCPACGKRLYESAKVARRVAKQIPGRHLNAYRCPRGVGWHLGHLPPGVLHGEYSKDDYVQIVESSRHRHSTGGGR